MYARTHTQARARARAHTHTHTQMSARAPWCAIKRAATCKGWRETNLERWKQRTLFLPKSSGAQKNCPLNFFSNSIPPEFSAPRYRTVDVNELAMLHKDQQNIRVRESGRATETWEGRVIVFVAMQEIRAGVGKKIYHQTRVEWLRELRDEVQ